MKIKKATDGLPSLYSSVRNYFLQLRSSDTVNFLRPFFLRAVKTLRPLAELMRLRKPCLFLRLRSEGWNVLFISIY